MVRPCGDTSRLYYGVLLYTMVYHDGTPWYTMDYHGVPWQYHCIPWYTMVIHGIPRTPWYTVQLWCVMTLSHHDIPWCTPWYTMDYHGLPWCTMVHRGIPWRPRFCRSQAGRVGRSSSQSPWCTMVYNGIPWYTIGLDRYQNLPIPPIPIL